MPEPVDISSGPALICGLDPGLQRTGYGIISTAGQHLKLVDAGFIATSADDELPVRLAQLYAELRAIFQEYPRVRTAAVEEVYSHYRHPRTAVLMAHARGVLLLAAKDAGVQVLSLPATMVKKALVGFGRAGKMQVQRAVSIRLGLTLREEIPADVTDALALAICGVEHMRSPQLAVRMAAQKAERRRESQSGGA
ncbi:MAG: crossover junction endodeoxyribonuclease RuvC [Phycisphaerae bacterium]|nr:crossover junction endodeoxyribonuclease RuvC [Phycisphaerae bacterium]